MAEEWQSKAIFQDIDGFRFPPIFDPQAYWSIRNHKPEDGEVFIVTFPKCGTNWTSQLVYLIHHRGVDLPAPLLKCVPFLDMLGTAALDSAPEPKTSRMHMPFSHTPWSEKAKYIYVARNPKDCLVSFYHFASAFKEFGEFFDAFLEGENNYGDFFDHVMSWYEHRDDPNVLFLTYESMKKDIRSTITNIARHLGEEYLEAVGDETVMANIIKYSSFEHMKLNADENLSTIITNMKATEGDDIDKWPITESLKFTLKLINKNVAKGEVNMYRKGIVGDWRAHFSDDQNKKLDEKIQNKFKGTEFLKEWEEMGCL